MTEKLIIHVGQFDNLDERLGEAAKKQALSFGGPRPPSIDREAETDVLLAASADGAPGGGSVYLIVGVFHDTILQREARMVTFKKLERFVVPIVVSNSTGEADAALLGAAKYWSPQDFYWCDAGSAERCIAEARRLEHPARVSG